MSYHQVSQVKSFLLTYLLPQPDTPFGALSDASKTGRLSKHKARESMRTALSSTFQTRITLNNRKEGNECGEIYNKLCDKLNSLDNGNWQINSLLDDSLSNEVRSFCGKAQHYKAKCDTALAEETAANAVDYASQPQELPQSSSSVAVGSKRKLFGQAGKPAKRNDHDSEAGDSSDILMPDA